MIGPTPMIDQRVEIDPTVQTEVLEIGKVEIKTEIKIPEIKGKIQVPCTIVHCYRLHKIFKKQNYSLKEDGNRDEQERYQIFLTSKTSWILRIQQTKKGFLVHQR